jgi:hypothetical protein
MVFLRVLWGNSHAACAHGVAACFGEGPGQRGPRISTGLVSLAVAVLVGGAAAFAAEPQPAEDSRPAQGETPSAVEDEAQAEAPAALSPEMAALRKGVRKALAVMQSQPFNTRDNTPGEIAHFCLVSGCDAEIGHGGPTGKKVNALGCLCWDFPCAGLRLLRAGDGRFMARIGYGLQSHPAEFLALLAQSAVPDDYEVRVGELSGTVADLVEYEKLHCRSGRDLSFALIGLMHYLKHDEAWKDDLGEDWSVERMIREELTRSSTLSGSELTHCLMGLSYAVDRRTKRELPLEGPFRSAQEYVDKFQKHALECQNPDGSWHPSFFDRQGTSTDVMGVVRSTGHILRWLVFSLPEDQLDDARVVRSITYVASLLGNQRSSWNVAAMSPRDIDAVMHAAHALAVYDRRVFKPVDPEDPTAQQAEALSYRSVPE